MAFAFRTGRAFWRALEPDAVLHGPITLRVVDICGACGDWLEAGTLACMITDPYEGGTMDHYTHWTCAQEELRRRGT